MPSSKILKIVLDTNIFLSALLFGGMAEKIIDLALDNQLQAFISADLSKEIFKKLHYFGADEAILTKTAKVLGSCVFIKPTVEVTVCRDPKDNFLLELAQTGKVEYLVTRDKDILDLPGQVWQETQIIKPELFLPVLRKLKLLA